MGNITLQQVYFLLATVVAVSATLGAFYTLLRKAFNKIYEPVTEIKQEVSELKTKVNGIQDGLCTQLRQSILKSCEDYTHRGYATINQKEALMKSCKKYEEYGGNGFVPDLVKQACKLPNEPDNTVN